MIRVTNENKSIDFYREAFGLEVAQRFPLGGLTALYLRNRENDFELELVIKHGRTEPYLHGDGYGHLAVAVDDIAMEHARFEALGLNPTRVAEFIHEGTLIAKFFFVEDPDGYKIEVLQKQGRYQ
jgi:lactoylglutathione lyase